MDSQTPAHSPNHVRPSATDDDDSSRLLMAVQKPRVTAAGTDDDGVNYATVEFRSGPNAGGQYSVQCYPVADPAAEPLSCAELEGLTPEASVGPDDLPKLYSNVANNVTGLFSETIDCYVRADGVTGLAEKCQWAGRTDGPWDASIANNGVTVRCPGVAVGGTFVLDGVTYTRRARADSAGPPAVDGLDTIVADNTRWGELPTVCTTGVDDMSQLFFQKTAFDEDISSWDTSAVTTMNDMCVLTSTAVRPPAQTQLSLTLTPRVARSLARFYDASDFDQPIGDWNTSAVKDMSYMWVSTSTTVRPPAQTQLSLTLTPRVARSPGSALPLPSTSRSASGTRARSRT